MTKTINSILINRIYELQMEYDNRDDGYVSSYKEQIEGEILARMDECRQIMKELEQSGLSAIKD